jgi:predicted DNA-binding transcriptional regulator AlpA
MAYEPARGNTPGLPANPPLLVRARVAAQMLAISRSTLYARVAAGRCPAPIRWDGCTVWRVRDLEAFVAELSDGVAA